ncbi:TRAP-type C4-dicarboxylate transport system permease small subunit [Rhodoligotrophos appendicifer]|uniref:TRAP transporter small permease subunit n=1 Tax=Rhodoligotrophos appendicifer TaxID=987056 RepID=UPI0011859E9C|nr:TRAP transporter small permease [Rhodoligotrophos appendicifer]
MGKLHRWITAVERVSEAISGFVVLAIMVIVAIDVVMRYAFNAPLSWSFDVISIYLMAAAFFLSASDTLRRGHHVAVDIAYEHFSPRLKILSKLVGWIMSAVVFGLMAALAARSALSRWETADVIAGAIAWPTWIPSALAAFGLSLLTLRLVVGSLGALASLLTGNERFAAPLHADIDRVEDTI